jgi:cytochrome c oxidase subunit II
MALSIALIVIVVGSVLFHLLSPWWTQPLASNWQRMDDTLAITLLITGAFFVAIHVVIIYAVLRWRHRSGQQPVKGRQRAAYAPDNHRLERWLTGITTVGIVALLAPGLVVYADYVHPPADALKVEVVGQQWRWRYRLAGADGELGRSDIAHVSADNPFGLDPTDAHARGDVLIDDNELHLPLARPVQLLLRSNDVLHDFFVPPFRARMNIVPGSVTTFWFTPTQAGRFELMCAQLCGIGHHLMRGVVVVEDEAAFQAWLARQPTFDAAKPAAS